MTLDEFKSKGWAHGETCSYRDEERDVCGVDFVESLIGLVENCRGSSDDDIQWVRCENVTVKKES